MGPFIFNLFLLNWFGDVKKEGDKISWIFKHVIYGMKDELLRRIELLGISGLYNQIELTLSRLISCNQNQIRSSKISIENVFSGKAMLLYELFHEPNVEFGTAEIIQTRLLTRMYNEVRKEVKVWISKQTEYSQSEKSYLYGQFRSSPSKKMTDQTPNEDWDPVGENFNGFFTIIMNIMKKAPQIQSRVWYDTEPIPAIKFTDTHGTKKTIEFSAKFLYDIIKIMKIPTSAGGFDNYVKIEGGFIENELMGSTLLALNEYDSFYSMMTTYLQKIASKLNKKVFYFDFVFLEKTGKFHRYKSRVYKLQSGSYLKLDFTKIGSDEYRQNLSRMYEALMDVAHIRLLGSEELNGNPSLKFLRIDTYALNFSFICFNNYF